MQFIEYELNGGVALISLNRPQQSNAQNAQLLEELDASFDRAVEDDTVRVIILRANGKHFSAGHDLSPEVWKSEPWKSMFADVNQTGLLRLYNWEFRHFFGYARKWRDLPKPTIAAVQGSCIGAGLMLAWPCDLIIASDDARFSDPVARVGIGGVEYHGHTWEMGHRKAKEMLFTGGFIDAAEAHRLGMVNRVVPRDELDAATLKLALEIAGMHPHALLMAKRAVNQTLDAQGQHNALQAAYDTHALGHANAWTMTGQAALAGLAELVRGNKEASKP